MTLCFILQPIQQSGYTITFRRRQVLQAGSGAALLSLVRTAGAQLNTETDIMPALFISHGTPLQAIWNNEFTRGWAELGESLPRPKAILSLSAHWITQGGIYLTGNDRPSVIYDMRGFPEALYQVTYPAVGEPVLATSIASSLKTAPAMTSEDWGYDHGTWVVLKHMYPEADIPVIQMSVNYAMPPEEHFRLGQEIAALRRQGVLVLGSGQFVHNLRLMGSRTEMVPAFDWAEEFSETVGQWVDDRNFDKVVNFQQLGDLAEIAHPTIDHFLPLLTVLGTVGGQEELRWINKGIISGSIDMRCLVAGHDV